MLLFSGHGEIETGLFETIFVRIERRNSASVLKNNPEVKYTMLNLLVMFVIAVCFLFLLQLKWPENKNFYDVHIEIMN